MFIYRLYVCKANKIEKAMNALKRNLIKQFVDNNSLHI